MNSTEFYKHDNIDREVIEISKDSLRLILHTCAKYSSISMEIGAYAGLSLTLLSTAFLTENFHRLWAIPGETLRATYLIGGIATLIYTVYKTVSLYKTKEKYTPESIINSLTLKPSKPVALLEAPHILEQKRNRKNRTTNSISEIQKIK